ncbi:MAG: hydrogenase nickel incorporation protein HypA [Opitutales bacterium]|nr:hydrogenase nickel incorporation protein HypA [Opitutales bacterium]
MIGVSFEAFVVFFLVAGLLGVVALWLFYDLRDKSYYDRQRSLRAHHCVRCGALYANRSEAEVATCPKCGFENASLRF